MLRPSNYLKIFEDFIIFGVRDLFFKKDGILPYKDGRIIYQYKQRILTQKVTDFYWKIKTFRRRFSPEIFSGSLMISGLSHSSIGGKDLTIDQIINKDGGIYSHADGKIHYSKRSYLDGIKEKGCHIKDY